MLQAFLLRRAWLHRLLWVCCFVPLTHQQPTNSHVLFTQPHCPSRITRFLVAWSIPTVNPLSASVVEKGNKGNGAVTDVDGNFTLRVSPKSTLLISYVGYKSQEVSVNGRNAVTVTLSEDAELLSDVVVIGYGTVKKADLAGSVAVMDNKAFKDQPITQASDALNGRMAGVNVVSDGIPGGSVKIRVRGSNSITKSNDPLYVVDGMVRESGLDGINPEDIQSMQVLKDASSTAIYGSRGANGVVIVTTKTGRKGESRITFDASYGFSKATKLPKMMSTKAYAQASCRLCRKERERC